MDARTNRGRFFFFVSSEFDKVFKSVQSFWSTVGKQLSRMPKGSKKPKAEVGHTTLDERIQQINKDRLDLTLFLEKHMGGADVCYAYSRQTFLTKLVTFVNEELIRIKNG